MECASTWASCLCPAGGAPQHVEQAVLQQLSAPTFRLLAKALADRPGAPSSDAEANLLLRALIFRKARPGVDGQQQLHQRHLDHPGAMLCLLRLLGYASSLKPGTIRMLLRTLAGLLEEGRQLPAFLGGAGMGAVVGFLRMFLAYKERGGTDSGAVLLGAARSAAACLLHMLRSSHAEVRSTSDVMMQGQPFIWGCTCPQSLARHGLCVAPLPAAGSLSDPA